MKTKISLLFLLVSLSVIAQSENIEELKEKVEEHPDSKEALFQYAAALKNAKQYEESEKVFGELLKLEPDQVNALIYRYLILQILGRPKEAEPLLARAEKTGRMDKFTYLGMGNTMYSIGKYEEGVQFFEKVIAADPTGVNLYNLACGYAKLGNKDEAFENLNKAIDNGFNSKQQFENDADLESLKEDSRFVGLLKKLK
ncbi:MAG: tetratricopeptide repeat protein [Cyclobacteriaceae bacterium]|nr:tetratricopeptide repeat protein [Cyclobacteriaceae bacterium]